MTGPEETVYQIYVHTEPAAYRGKFYNTDWAVAAINRIRGSRVEAPLSELLFEWRLIVSAFQFPWMVAESPVNFEEGAGILRSDVEKAERRAIVWAEYFTDRTFSMAVSALMRQSYASLLFAYEHFLLKCFRLKSGDMLTKTSEKKFSREFSKFFPKDIQYCWSDGEIERARKVRNAIAHAGAEAGAVPKAKGFVVVGGVLQITPGDVEKLMGHLQKAVDRLCKAVVT